MSDHDETERVITMRGIRNLGAARFIGLGGPQDWVEAYKWLEVATALAPAESRAAAVKNRDMVGSELKKGQVAEARKRAREWLAAFEKRKK